MITDLHSWRHRIIKDLVLLLGVSLLVRALFLSILPATAVSWDFQQWMQVIELLRRHENPYNHPPYLDWPPFWMQILYGVSFVSDKLHLSITHSIQGLLITVESLTLAVTYLTLQRFFPKTNPRTPLLWGVALNPIAVLLVCQHGNFDIFATLWMGLMLYAFLSFRRSGDVMDWLWTTVFLGLGILTKTFPLVLFPVLFYRIRSLSLRARLLGYLLAVGPTMLGLSVLYVLTPQDILTHVINYRSEQGLFGITGILRLLHATWWTKLYLTTFPFFLICFCGFLALKVSELSSECPDRLFVLLPAFLLMLAPGIGPGYASQYIYWFMPMLVMSYSLYGRRWRYFLLAAYGVISIMYMIEYGFRCSYGFSAMYFIHNPALMQFSLSISTKITPTFLLRLPIFAVYVILLIESYRLISKDLRASKN